MIEVTGFPHLTQKFAVRAVPKVILNETHDFTGSLPETDFVKMILEAGGKRKSRPA
jgi:thioredoxin-related protein